VIKSPTMVGKIERRLLVNFRVDPGVLSEVLPAPFRPRIVGDVGMVGICLIRLGELRPLGLPRWLGLTTENAAHRIAVEWDGDAGPCQGVYIPRRDTNSRVTVLLGGRVFPGKHHFATFEVHESGDNYEVAYVSRDDSVHVAIAARRELEFPEGSVFSSLNDASAFFQWSPLGFSPTKRAGGFEGLELQCSTWSVEPLSVQHVESSVFMHSSDFPSDAVAFDSALLMREIPARWRRQNALTSLNQSRMQSSSRL
jgi:hypothetical protein